MLRRRVLQRDRRDRDAKIPTRIRAKFQDVSMRSNPFCSALSTRKTRTSSTREWRHRCRLPAASSRLAPLVAERPFFFLRRRLRFFFHFSSEAFFLKIASKKVSRGRKRDAMPPSRASSLSNCFILSFAINDAPSLRDGSGRCAKRASQTGRRPRGRRKQDHEETRTEGECSEKAEDEREERVEL